MNKWGEQLDLFETKKKRQPAVSEEDIYLVERLALRLARSHGYKVHTVRWKNNRRVMASVSEGGILNLHNIYKKASKDDLVALTNVMANAEKKGDRERFLKYIEKHLPKELGEGSSRLVVLPPKGLFHDLNKALKNVLPLLNKPLKKVPKVGWSPVRVGTKGITWGTHRDTPDGPLILVNAVLDAHDVPYYVVEHILWHEICHEAMPPENDSNGRRLVHSKIFREMENRYSKTKLAEEWELKNVTGLIKKHLKRNRRRRKTSG